MELSDRIPGMKPGHRIRNFVVGVGWFLVIMTVLGAVFGGGDDPGEPEEAAAEAEAEAGDDTTEDGEEEEAAAENEESQDESDDDGADTPVEDEQDEADDEGADEQQDSEDTAEQEEGDDSTEQEGLVITEHELVIKDEGEVTEQPIVQGIVENQLDEDLDYVEVRVRVYDEDGNQLEQYIANTQNLAAGGSWAFEVLILEDAEDIADYDIEVVDSPLA